MKREMFFYSKVIEVDQGNDEDFTKDLEEWKEQVIARFPELELNEAVPGKNQYDEIILHSMYLSMGAKINNENAPT